MRLDLRRLLGLLLAGDVHRPLEVVQRDVEAAVADFAHASSVAPPGCLRRDTGAGALACSSPKARLRPGAAARDYGLTARNRNAANSTRWVLPCRRVARPGTTV